MRYELFSEVFKNRLTRDEHDLGNRPDDDDDDDHSMGSLTQRGCINIAKLRAHNNFFRLPLDQLKMNY